MNNQDKLLEYIKTHIRGTGRPPSLRQMAEYLGLSREGARYNLKKLQQGGKLIVKDSHREMELLE